MSLSKPELSQQLKAEVAAGRNDGNGVVKIGIVDVSS